MPDRLEIEARRQLMKPVYSRLLPTSRRWLPEESPPLPNPPESSRLLPPIAYSLPLPFKQTLVKFFYGDGQEAFFSGSAEATTIPAGGASVRAEVRSSSVC